MRPSSPPMEAAVLAVSLPLLHLAVDSNPQRAFELCQQVWDFTRGAVDEAGGLGPFLEAERALWVAPSVPLGLELAFGISRSLSRALLQRGLHQPLGTALGSGDLWISAQHGVHGAEALRVRTLASVWIGPEIACTLAARDRLEPPPGLGLSRAPGAAEERYGQAFFLVSDYR